MTSGAMYSMVPISELERSPSRMPDLASPKSVMRMCPSASSSTFSCVHHEELEQPRVRVEQGYGLEPVLKLSYLKATFRGNGQCTVESRAPHVLRQCGPQQARGCLRDVSTV